MAHQATQRRNLEGSDLKPSMDPTFKRQHKPTTITSMSTKPDPQSFSKPSHMSTPQNLSTLQTIHKFHTSGKSINPQPFQPLKDTHLQATAMTVSAIVDSSSKFSLPKADSQPQKVSKAKHDACDEKKSTNSFKDLDKKKFYELILTKKKDAHEVFENKSLCATVKNKECKDIEEGHDYYTTSRRVSISLSSRGGRRRSFGGSQVELADVFANNGVKVFSVDMPPFMQIHAVDFARKTHDSMEKFTSKTLASTLKKEFDGVYGPAWHCIVGTSFGSFVTHSVGGFLYFSMDQKLYILLFKTTVQRAD